MSKFTIALASLALLAVAGLSGCASNEQANPGAVPSSTFTESTEPLPEGTEPVEGAGADESSYEEDKEVEEEEEDPLYKFGDTVTYESGIQITVEQPKSFKDYSYPEELGKGERAVKFTITVKNDSDKRWDPSLLTTTASSGEEEAAEIFDSANDVGMGADTKLLKGKERSWAVGYHVLKGEDFVLEISPDFESEAAIFVS